MTLDSSFTFSSVSPAKVPIDRLEGGSSSKDSLPPGSSTPLVFGDENVLLRAFLKPSGTLSSSDLFPLCLFGPTGTGKSDIARWIAQTHYPELDLLVSNAADYFRDYIEAVDLDYITDFRQSYCSPDRLVIFDNLEELALKPKALAEFEYLLTHCRHLIITCSRNPSDLPAIPYRISSRILQGLSIPVTSPSTEILEQILRYEISSIGAHIEDSAITWLADFSIRCIADIKQVIARLRIEVNFDHSISLAEIQKIFFPSSTDIPSLSEITKLVAKQQKLKVSDLKSQSRKRCIVQARGLAIFIARHTYHYKYDDIGQYFSNRDHSTIMHAHRKFQENILSDPLLQKVVHEISLALDKPVLSTASRPSPTTVPNSSDSSTGRLACE